VAAYVAGDSETGCAANSCARLMRLVKTPPQGAGKVGLRGSDTPSID